MRAHLGLRTWSPVMFAIVLLMGLGAIAGFFRVRRSIDVILRDRFEGLLSAQQMAAVLDNTERQIVAFVVGDGEAAPGLPFPDPASEVAQGIGRLRGTSRDDDSRRAVVAIEQAWAAYQATARDFRERFEQGETAECRALYRDRLSLDSHRLKAAVGSFITLNQEAVRQTREDAAVEARRWFFAMGGITLVGLISTILFSQQVVSLIIRPLQRQSRTIDRVTFGEIELRLPPEREGALNSLADSANRLIENYEAIHEDGRHQIKAERRYSLALVEAFRVPALLLDGNGSLIVSNSAARELFTGTDGRARLEALTAALGNGAAPATIQLADRTYRAECRPCGQIRGFTGRVVLLEPA